MQKILIFLIILQTSPVLAFTPNESKSEKSSDAPEITKCVYPKKGDDAPKICRKSDRRVEPSRKPNPSKKSGAAR